MIIFPQISHPSLTTGQGYMWSAVSVTILKQHFIVFSAGGKNKPVLSHQAWESGQRAGGRPGAAGCVCFIWAVTDDG